MSSELAADPGAALRRSIYVLLITLSVGQMLGRIAAVNAVDQIGVEKVLVGRELDQRKKQLAEEGLEGEALDEQVKAAEKELRAKHAKQRPFLSANDRSRWATVRALVEQGTYHIDDIIAQPNWDTIDMVQHVGRDGEKHLYSSKPPLLATLIAGPYWVIHKVTGATLGSHPYEIGRPLVVLINVVPLALMFWLLARFAERFGLTDWGKFFIVGAACFATFLTTFANTLNNHIPAAVSTMITLHCVWRIWYDGRREWRYFIGAGFFAAFTAANELPALSLFAAVTIALLWKVPGRTLLGYIAGAAVVVAAFFGTNYAAHDTLSIPYLAFGKDNPDENWYDFEYVRKSDGRVIQSYWRNPSGIDRGEPSAAMYVVHSLVGHHGIFSLTPMWLLMLPGLVALIASRRYNLQAIGLAIAVLTVVCVTFYVLRPPDQRTYGGMTSGFRWAFWFTPLWLAAMLPVVDYLAERRWGRILGLILVALSALSASYPIWNPWTHPWLTNFMLYMEWIKL